MQINHYTRGSAVTLEVLFKNSNAVPANPTSVTLKIRDPGGAISTLTGGALQNPQVGTYQFVVLPSLEGLYEYRFDGDGAVDAAVEGAFVLNPGSV